MKKGSTVNYRELYNRVGKTLGWDFSKLRVKTEGEKWNFYDEVVKHSNKTGNLLDIGTGGGEKILDIANKFISVTGIDNSPEMIKTAEINKTKSKIDNADFIVMDSSRLLFPDSVFDTVSCRHADFNAQEVFRVLKNDKTFLTQQVGEGDKINLKQWFGRGQNFGKKDGTAIQKYATDLKNAGFLEIKIQMYDAKEYYYSQEDLIFLLQNTPIIPRFGESNNDFSILAEFINKFTTPKGIQTNSKRYLITANK